jgi:F-type H+-transporting ATPase subunit epsilon
MQFPKKAFYISAHWTKFKMNDKDKLILIIKSRENLIYEGDVKSITSFNEVGRFDILPGHANFISLVNQKVIFRDINDKQVEIPLQDGIIRVEANYVNVYLGISSISA